MVVSAFCGDSHFCFLGVVMELLVKKVSDLAVLPTVATTGSAGFDLCACIEAPVKVSHGEIVKIPTGIAVALPVGTAGFLMGRSGLGIKHGVVPANAVGLIDSDYRGEIVVGLTCNLEAGYVIQPAERVAQLVVVPIVTPVLKLVEDLDSTQRGAGGFGSTGNF